MCHADHQNREDGTSTIFTVTLTLCHLLRNSCLHPNVHPKRMIYPFLVLYIKPEAVILETILLLRGTESLAVCVKKNTTLNLG
jgi:hypothetical protein